MARAVTLTATVRDSVGNITTRNATVSINEAPIIDNITVTPLIVPSGGTALITITAHDPESDPLVFSCLASEGTLTAGTTPGTFTWRAP